MANEIELFKAQEALVEARRTNYVITSPYTNADGSKNEVVLKRGLDFDVIPKTKSPTLLKSGCEKVCKAYGVFAKYIIASKMEQIDPEPFFYYSFECQLIKLAPNGQEYLVANGFGSSNSKERRNGFNSAYDSANATMKMAEKRALAAAAINLGGLSGLFSQDLDNENFVSQNFEEIKATSDDNAPITSKQIKRLYAIGNEAGKNVEQMKQFLASKGYTSSKDIKQKDYDDVCKLVGENK